MKRLTIAAPAKINLILNVLGTRTDGYHELETIMHKIDLIDIIHVEATSEGITVESNSGLIPTGVDNLAYQAAALLMEYNGIKAGVNIFIEKNIPVGAGLAGGSSDAAAVLTALNRVFQLKLPDDRLQEMGAAVGSDVPFCLGSETALARGRGELLTPLDRGPKLDLLLVMPDFQVSTAEVYRAYKIKNNYQPADTAAFIKFWQSGDIINIANCISNDLETVSIPKHNEINHIKTDLRQAGAVNSLMSGSGPAVFGIFADQKTAINALDIMQKLYKRVYQVTSYYRE
ncbi:MAG TPA: 4-(cytidine 5'-diphospho)-2-C-methyl-D-erythritol kinase [Syntrophomonadaceae bacterium]|nr:4-(cytidine 5'-diphospho)-2-C-methyl-D-erythritol kinase [Syntrophomonadaceae bacterium]HNX28868.1 4-(cytidine 5'-diphospho)-2-C-methyl-D-erythritol kinase [Syntrophomonadaceae bacterium]HPR93264.1 4-(cytidine 5'-diphospho)-2-C-methyl-D-erythritol kinase [Syntrophomonadaceae bacterium]